MNPLVSVNLATYNRAHLIARALDSVLRQSYQNVEIIVVDDFSNDNTKEVVDEYASLHNNIKYVCHEKNMGLAATRNTAWKKSGGKYVAFMDDDDEWIDPDKLTKQVGVFEECCHSEIGVVCSSVRLFSNEFLYADKIIYPPANLKSKILSGNGIIYSPTAVAPKSVLEHTGGFDVNLTRGVDSEFYRTCIVKYGYGVYFMPDVTTAVHEYGGDRITLRLGRGGARKLMKANAYILRKYCFYYVFFPKSFWLRLKALSFGVVRLLFPER